MAKVKLTTDERVVAIERVRKGESTSAVARAVGISESTLRSWLKKGVRKNHIDEATKKNAIERAIMKQASQSLIAREINVPESTLRSWIKKQQQEVQKEVGKEVESTTASGECRQQIRREEVHRQLESYIEDVVKVTVALLQTDGRKTATPEYVVHAMDILNDVYV